VTVLRLFGDHFMDQVTASQGMNGDDVDVDVDVDDDDVDDDDDDVVDDDDDDAIFRGLLNIVA
jgi:hypothetical protein